jgi:prepilin-type N-terminal cleavage/methylation domain-containing protein
MSSERGLSLVEMLVVCGVVGVLAASAAPSLRAYARRAHIEGATRVFKGEFAKARSMAVRNGVYTAIRFEPTDDGVEFSVYADGNRNGVRSVDIEAGLDRRIAGPFPVTGGAPGVRLGFTPGLPAVPPETGRLKGEDPIRFGKTDILSFSPLGTATPGTFYLAGDHAQGAVRVTTNARVRLLLWLGGRWQER